MSTAHRWARRYWNAGLRVTAGLRLHSESVSPLVPNDLFQAHLSIYRFFGSRARGRRALDLGSGTGYGADHLLTAGAREVVGIDLDPRSVSFARRRYGGRPGLSFRVADAEDLPQDLGRFDLIVSSNVLEHLHDPRATLRSIAGLLEPTGELGLVVPPIVGAQSMQANQRIRFHHSNLYLWEWIEMLRGNFEKVWGYCHSAAAGPSLDFTDPFPSRWTSADFTFTEVSPDDLAALPTLGAVFLCSGA